MFDEMPKKNLGVSRKVFNELPNGKVNPTSGGWFSELNGLKQIFSAKEYYETLLVYFIVYNFHPSMALVFFVDGHEEEIQRMVRLFKPQTVSDAYYLAKIQELTLSKTKPKDSIRTANLPTPSISKEKNYEELNMSGDFCSINTDFPVSFQSDATTRIQFTLGRKLNKPIKTPPSPTQNLPNQGQPIELLNHGVGISGSLVMKEKVANFSKEAIESHIRSVVASIKSCVGSYEASVSPLKVVEIAKQPGNVEDIRELELNDVDKHENTKFNKVTDMMWDEPQFETIKKVDLILPCCILLKKLGYENIESAYWDKLTKMSSLCGIELIIMKLLDRNTNLTGIQMEDNVLMAGGMAVVLNTPTYDKAPRRKCHLGHDTFLNDKNKNDLWYVYNNFGTEVCRVGARWDCEGQTYDVDCYVKLVNLCYNVDTRGVVNDVKAGAHQAMFCYNLGLVDSKTPLEPHVAVDLSSQFTSSKLANMEFISLRLKGILFTDKRRPFLVVVHDNEFNKGTIYTFKNPKREFRSSRKLFKTISLDESSSPEFDLFFDLEEHSEEEVAVTMAETMEEYMNKPSGSIKTWDDLKEKFLSKYCPPARTAKKIEEINNFQQEPDKALYQAWERFKELLKKCLQHYLTEMLEVILFYNGLEVSARQILDSKGAIPTKTAVDAKVAIQEMAEYSQK
nr:hypothetical protein [Tanacetum cinerariifolium]